ncbi:hypothetical protein BLA29_004235 [Euroglyphus maynei]|uniref:Uncharacterized protein n=1 Tax=Euroglyphus maynei TaxID=6958 RepID=A0A1Y3B2S4_EURMA|nr:hypothetical protein BLA29_004235 [Euroglyphus maynei]
MNVDNNSDQNESLEAPEDDDFGDFEGAEDEAPEAVQAMIGGPNWVYPDLVRIQSSNNNTQNDTNNPELNNFNNQNRQNSHRILDPPDVSLLTNISNSHCSKPQQTLDLCSSLGSSLNNPIPSTSNGIISSSNVFGMNQQLTQMEQRIRSLQTEKRLLQEQLCERDNRINDLQRIAHHQQQQTLVEQNNNGRLLEETIGRHIDSAFERIQNNLETSMADLINRVERLERKVDKNNSSGSVMNGMVIDNGGNGESLHHEPYVQLFQQLKQEQQQERREYMKTLSNILSHALQELNNTFKP